MRKAVLVRGRAWRLAVGWIGIASLVAGALVGCGGGRGAGSNSDAGPRGGSGAGGQGGNGAGTGGETGTGGAKADGGAQGGTGGSAKTDGPAPRDGEVPTCVGDACPACGLAGLPCCNDTCANPSLACNLEYVCEPCGGPGQPCCPANPTCNTSLACQSGELSRCTCAGDAGAGACSACGALGQLCCANGACASGAICAGTNFNNYCAPCGGPGQPCCAGDGCAANGCCFLGTCVADGEACKIPNVTYGTCSGGSCGCGRLGQPCCPIANSVTAATPGKCSDPTTVCQFGGNPEMCIHCGDPGEPCCGTTTECNGTAVCDLANDINPMCAPCGVTGNPCCAGNKCTSSSDCCSEDGSVQVGRCVATGSACRQLNSGGAGVCMSGNCR